LLDNLNQRQINFRCLTQDLDTSTAGGRLIFTIFSAIAEFEREMIRERTRAGVEAARARGRQGGRPRKMTGDKIKQAQTLAQNPDYSVKEICEAIGVGRDTYYRHMKG
jgi:DNA invertase Pin-like site-specific DNA recombinase